MLSSPSCVKSRQAVPTTLDLLKRQTAAGPQPAALRDAAAVVLKLLPQLEQLAPPLVPRLEAVKRALDRRARSGAACLGGGGGQPAAAHCCVAVLRGLGAALPAGHHRPSVLCHGVCVLALLARLCLVKLRHPLVQPGLEHLVARTQRLVLVHPRCACMAAAAGRRFEVGWAGLGWAGLVWSGLAGQVWSGLAGLVCARFQSPRELLCTPRNAQRFRIDSDVLQHSPLTPDGPSGSGSGHSTSALACAACSAACTDCDSENRTMPELCKAWDFERRRKQGTRFREGESRGQDSGGHLDEQVAFVQGARTVFLDKAWHILQSFGETRGKCFPAQAGARGQAFPVCTCSHPWSGTHVWTVHMPRCLTCVHQNMHVRMHACMHWPRHTIRAHAASRACMSAASHAPCPLVLCAPPPPPFPLLRCNSALQGALSSTLHMDDAHLAGVHHDLLHIPKAAKHACDGDLVEPQRQARKEERRPVVWLAHAAAVRLDGDVIAERATRPHRQAQHSQT
eukprot:363421-Chlamydomonas_euryale.AAC.2